MKKCFHVFEISKENTEQRKKSKNLEKVLNEWSIFWKQA